MKKSKKGKKVAKVYSPMGSGEWLSLLVGVMVGEGFQDQEKAAQGDKRLEPMFKSKKC